MNLPEIRMNDMARAVAAWRKEKGFKTPASINTPEERTLMMEKLMLVVTEISEAAEAVRHNNKKNFVEELSDATIRILDICGTGEIDIEGGICEKMVFNDTRPLLHGKTL